MSNPNYACTKIFDDFNGTSLSNIWTPVEHFYRQAGFFVNNTATINVANGNLELSMIYSPGYVDSTWVEPGEWETITKDYICGEVVSKEAYKSGYGIFECRAKFASGSGSWPAFWLHGTDGIDCEDGGGYGNEIDIAEYNKKLNLSEMMHVIHWTKPIDNCTDEKKEAMNSKDYYFSPNDTYKIFKCIWTSDEIEFYIDDVISVH